MTTRSRALLGCFGVVLSATAYLEHGAARVHGASAATLEMPAGTAQGTSAKTSHPDAASDRALLNKYCVTCHNERRKTAGLMLDRLNIDDVGDAAELWEKVVQKLRTHEMPPPGMPRPDKATYEALTARLETALDRAAALKRNPGRVPIHRLNRAEYTNAIRDLFAMDIDGRALLPADEADQHGFDNIAAVLSVSPALLERYMAAARKVSRLAVGDPTIVPVFETYKILKMLAQDDQRDDDLPFGSRGGVAIRHLFPVDGEYVVKIRLRRQLYNYILGLGAPHDLDVRLDGQRIRRFTVGGEGKGNPAPETFVGNTLGEPEWEKYMHEADAGLEVRFAAKAGTRPREPEGVFQPPQTGFNRATNEQYHGNPAVDSVAIGGPFQVAGPGESPTRRKVFVCRPAAAADESPCATKILSTLARRAYRRPVTDADIETLLPFYEAGRRAGGFEQGIQRAIERLLADPDFLFRIERDPKNVAPGTPYRLTDLELASRLSFFLWSSIPDEELLDLAIRGKLSDGVVLERQVRRMLGDARSKALVSNFAGQWLGLRKISGMAPDPDAFPDFDDNLREAFQLETELFMESQLREDRSVLDLLNADYTFVNERLARHYGIPNVYGNRFRRVRSSDVRRGLLGQGSILALTSYPNRTSPVIRGKWLLDNVLGAPPPPPPPNVPDLKASGDDGKPRSVRERMEQHRENPACASCHVRMDPLGFALENFDAIGKWRSTSDGAPIDASGVLPDGTRFEGVAGLRALVATHDDQLVATVTRRLLTYALGRGAEFYDLPAIRSITRDAAANDYRWSSIILGIVRSAPFQMRRSES